ncbi:MAG: hypothetical protein ACI9KE_000853 [Polyangiales bacterium]
MDLRLNTQVSKHLSSFPEAALIHDVDPRRVKRRGVFVRTRKCRFVGARDHALRPTKGQGQERNGAAAAVPREEFTLLKPALQPQPKLENRRLGTMDRSPLCAVLLREVRLMAGVARPTVVKFQAAHTLSNFDNAELGSHPSAIPWDDCCERLLSRHHLIDPR